MNIKLIEIKDRGVVNKERIIIRVLNATDIGYYIVFLTEKIEKNSFSANPEKVYWFPDREIEEGDLVVLYTKHGKDSVRENKSGSKTHFFYWGVDSASFKDKESVAVVIEANGWLYI